MQSGLAVIAIAGSAVILAPWIAEPVVERGPEADLPTHIQQVQAGAFSPDGMTFATCGLDKTVRLWNVMSAHDGALDAPVVLPDDAVSYSVAFSPDGSLIGTVGAKALTIWKNTAGKYELLSQARTARSSCLAFSPDGKTIAVGSDDGGVTLHESRTAKERMVLFSHANAVRSLAFSPDGHYLVSAGQDSLIVLWDADRGILIRPLLKGAANPNHVVAFSPDGGTIAVGEHGSMPTEILLIDVGTGAVRERLAGHSQGVRALAFAPNGRVLASAGVDHGVKLWNLAEGKERITFSNDVGSVSSLQFMEEGAWLLFAGDGVPITAQRSATPGVPVVSMLPLRRSHGMAVTSGGLDTESGTAGAVVSPARLPRKPAAAAL
jgi:WD40 repeat protein